MLSTDILRNLSDAEIRLLETIALFPEKGMRFYYVKMGNKGQSSIYRIKKTLQLKGLIYHIKGTFCLTPKARKNIHILKNQNE